MGQVPVVSERQFDGGEKLIRELVGRGLVLVGACWAKTEDDGRTYLYLVAPGVQDSDARPTYMTVNKTIADIDARKGWAHWSERVDGFDVMLAGPEDAMGKALAREYRQYSGDNPTFRKSWIDTIPVEGAALVYPPALFAAPAAAG